MKEYTSAESVKLVLSGNDYFDRLSAVISCARETLHIQTYIFEQDSIGITIKEELIAASGRGVKIFLLADAFGSKGLSKEFISEIKSAGINFRFFSPIFSSEGIFLGRRLHHKIVVADKKIALIGGINIADKYRGTISNPPWLDLAALICGDCCEYLHNVCEGIYHKKITLEDAIVSPEKKNHPLVRFRRNDWVRGKNEIHKSYIEAISGSHKSITILASYFLPGIKFRKLLKKATARGISVKIIVSGPSDVPFVRLAEKYLYSYFLNAGAEIFEWKESVMHGKLMIADKSWVTIGSYNVNYLSHYRSVEMNVDVKDTEFSKEIALWLECLINNHCAQVTSDQIRRSQGTFHKLKSRFAYYFLQGIMSIILPIRRINIL